MIKNLVDLGKKVLSIPLVLKRIYPMAVKNFDNNWDV